MTLTYEFLFTEYNRLKNENKNLKSEVQFLQDKVVDAVSAYRLVLSRTIELEADLDTIKFLNKERRKDD